MLSSRRVLSRMSAPPVAMQPSRSSARSRHDRPPSLSSSAVRADPVPPATSLAACATSSSEATAAAAAMAAASAGAMPDAAAARRAMTPTASASSDTPRAFSKLNTCSSSTNSSGSIKEDAESGQQSSGGSLACGAIICRAGAAGLTKRNECRADGQQCRRRAV